MPEKIGSLKITDKVLEFVQCVTDLELLFNKDEELMKLMEDAIKLASIRNHWDKTLYYILSTTLSRLNAIILLLHANHNDIAFAQDPIKKILFDFRNSISPIPQEAA
jgi:hypothetical protein